MVINIRIGNNTSYQNIAEEVCRVNEWECKIYRRNIHTIPNRVNLYIGSISDVAYEYMWLKDKPIDVIYMVIEGELADPYDRRNVAQLCNKATCISVTKWGKELAENMGITNIADVIYHAIPGDERVYRRLRNREGSLDAVYLNGYYKFEAERQSRNEVCDRKGWRFWPKICERFDAVGYITGSGNPSDCVIKVNLKSDTDAYRLLVNGKVYTSLTINEGFGLNNLMALAVGRKMVAWSIPLFRELYEGIDGVYLVETDDFERCFIGYASAVKPTWLPSYWGDINKYIDRVHEALNSTVSVDYGKIEQKFSKELYKRLGEYVVAKIA